MVTLIYTGCPNIRDSKAKSTHLPQEEDVSPGLVMAALERMEGKTDRGERKQIVDNGLSLYCYSAQSFHLHTPRRKFSLEKAGVALGLGAE